MCRDAADGLRVIVEKMVVVVSSTWLTWRVASWESISLYSLDETRESIK